MNLFCSRTDVRFASAEMLAQAEHEPLADFAQAKHRRRHRRLDMSVKIRSRSEGLMAESAVSGHR